jgi:hypothetical protein
MALAGAGQGIQSLRPGVGPLGSALTGFSRGFILSNAAERAAQDYALKQQQAEEDRAAAEIDRAYKVALTKRAERPEPEVKPAKVDPWNLPDDEKARYYENLRQETEAKAKGTPGGGEVMTMSPAALTNAAKVYANTGQLPPMGMAKNASGLRVAIMERAAELYPDLNITQNRANFAKDQRALTETQRLYDLSTAFEQTASLNGDVMLEAADGIPEFGNQFANQVARYVATKSGSPAMARFNAALETLKTEYAKILSSPGTAGGVLTDTARREMSHVIGGNQTKAQLVNSLKTLKRDAANKRKSYADKIREIQSRIGPASFGAQNLGGEMGGDIGDADLIYNPETGQLEPAR